MTSERVESKQEIIEIAARMFHDNALNGITSSYNELTGKLDMSVEGLRVGSRVDFPMMREILLQQLQGKPAGQYYLRIIKAGDTITLDMPLADFQLLGNDEERLPFDELWFVNVEEALALTKVQHDVLPLPFLYPGVNVVQQPPSIGFDKLETIRILIGDDTDPYYFSNQDLTKFYQTEGQDLEQAAALACEVWANRLAYNDGTISAQGVTINSSAMAAEKRQMASTLRLRFVKG